MMGEKRQAIATVVYDYMKSHPNEALYLSQIANDLGREPGSVSTALGRFAQMDDAPIERVKGPDGPVRGLYIWRIGPKAKAETPKPNTKPIFEYVGTVRDGSIIAQGEDGKLYRLTEL
jgi:hypothetical protein